MSTITGGFHLQAVQIPLVAENSDDAEWPHVSRILTVIFSSWRVYAMIRDTIKNNSI